MSHSNGDDDDDGDRGDGRRGGLRSSQAFVHARVSPRSGDVAADGRVKDQEASGLLVNLTPHAVHVLKCGGELGSDATVVYPPDPRGAVRLRSTPQTLAEVRPDDVHVYSMPDFDRERLDNFPYGPDDAAHPDILVAGLVAPYVPRWFRGQVLVPDTGPESVIRDSEGRIQAVRRLYEVPPACKSAPPTQARKAGGGN